MSFPTYLSRYFSYVYSEVWKADLHAVGRVGAAALSYLPHHTHWYWPSSQNMSLIIIIIHHYLWYGIIGYASRSSHCCRLVFEGPGNKMATTRWWNLSWRILNQVFWIWGRECAGVLHPVRHSLTTIVAPRLTHHWDVSASINTAKTFPLLSQDVY